MYLRIGDVGKTIVLPRLFLILYPTVVIYCSLWAACYTIRRSQRRHRLFTSDVLCSFLARKVVPLPLAQANIEPSAANCIRPPSPEKGNSRIAAFIFNPSKLSQPLIHQRSNQIILLISDLELDLVSYIQHLPMSKRYLGII